MQLKFLNEGKCFAFTVKRFSVQHSNRGFPFSLPLNSLLDIVYFYLFFVLLGRVLCILSNILLS